MKFRIAVFLTGIDQAGKLSDVERNAAKPENVIWRREKTYWDWILVRAR